MIEGEVIVYIVKGRNQDYVWVLFLGLVLVPSLDYIETLIDQDSIYHQPS